MKRIIPIIGAFLALVSCGQEKTTDRTEIVSPENSKLFEKTVDPESMAVSYRLKKNVVAPCQQSIYFVNKSMTDDGRFLIFQCAGNEWEDKGTVKSYALIDFLKDEAYKYPLESPFNPFLDVKTDILYYINKRGVFKRELLADPMEEVKICSLPDNYLGEGNLEQFCSHLTLNKERTKIFLDSRFTGPHWVEGIIDLTTGQYEKWGEEDNYPINHGQFNPVRDDIALCAHETSWTTRSGEKVRVKNWNGVYPRLQLLEKGKRTMVPAANNYASHERWDEQGEGFYWCSNSVWYCDLSTMKQTMVCPYGAHAMMSYDRNYVICDDRIGPFFRGAGWRLFFWDRELSEGLYVSYAMPAIGTAENQSKLHPDPHPQFVCNDKYAIWTELDFDRTMNLMITPVEQLGEQLKSKLLGGLPYDQSPVITWNKLYRRITKNNPQDMFWQAAMNLLHRIGEKEKENVMTGEYYRSLEGREDCSIIALETYLSSHEREQDKEQWLKAGKFGFSQAEKGKNNGECLYEKVLLQVEAWRACQKKEFLDKALELSSIKAENEEKAQRLAASAVSMRYLSSSDPRFVALNERFVKEASELVSSQGKDGLWNSDINESAVYAYALAEGVFHGWIDGANYSEVLRKAWASLCNAQTTSELGDAALMNLCNLLI